MEVSILEQGVPAVVVNRSVGGSGHQFHKIPVVEGPTAVATDGKIGFAEQPPAWISLVRKGISYKPYLPVNVSARLVAVFETAAVAGFLQLVSRCEPDGVALEVP